ncbi:MAG: hypothetical protein ACREMQ_16230 [Longimicrobiales bacterium]
MPDGDTLLVEQAHAGDRVTQQMTATLRVTRLNAAGEAVERAESSWTSRYVYRYEAVHLLSRSGFDLEELVGDYEGGPVTDKGQLIFTAVRSH